MKIITMYELLGLVKDGKAPKKVKYINSIWEYDKETKDYFNDDSLWLIYSMNSIGLTEREVEILEEKKIPEKLDISNFPRHNNSLKKTAIKLNQVIDYLKSKGEN